MAEFEKSGWHDKLASWADKYAADPDSVVDIYDELEAMLTAQNDPKQRALLQEVQELKRQQEAKAEQKPEAKPTVDDRVFDEHVLKSVEKVNMDAVWKGSPLLDHETDTAEMKETKAYLRDALNQKTYQAIQSHQGRSRLASGFRSGQAETAMYQKYLTETFDDAIQKTANDRKQAEKILDKLYGKTRNAKLVQQTTTAQPVQQGQPQVPATVPTNFAPTGVKTDDQIASDLEAAFAAHTSR